MGHNSSYKVFDSSNFYQITNSLKSSELAKKQTNDGSDTEQIELTEKLESTAMQFVIIMANFFNVSVVKISRFGLGGDKMSFISGKCPFFLGNLRHDTSIP